MHFRNTVADLRTDWRVLVLFKKVLIVKETYNDLNSTNQTKYTRCPLIERLGLFIIFRFDDVYATYILGFSSAIIIEELNELFHFIISSDPISFKICIFKCITMIFANIFMYRISIILSSISKNTEKYMTGKWNFIMNHYEDYFKERIIRLSHNTLLFIAMIVLLVVLMVFNWIHINGFIPRESSDIQQINTMLNALTPLCKQ